MFKPFYPLPRALCSVEDETGGDAGGEDNAQDSTTETNSGAATPQKQGEKLFTQAEVDALIVKAKRRVENKVRKETATSQPAATTSSETDVLKELANIRAELQAEKADRAFADALAGSGLTLTAKQRSVLRSQFDPENPDGVVELAKEIYPSAVAAPPTQRRAPGTYVDPGAPNPQAATERTSLLGMSGDDIRRLQAEGRFKDELEKFKSETFGQRSLFARRKKK